MVTVVRPAVEPADGLTPVTVKAQSPKFAVIWLLSVLSGDCTCNVWLPGLSAPASMRSEDSTLVGTPEPSTMSCDPSMKFEPLTITVAGLPPLHEFAALEIEGVPAS